MKIKNIDQIEKIVVHWSESSLINDELGKDGSGDIEKEISVEAFDDLIKRSSKLVKTGYDKTSLSVLLKNGVQWSDGDKFYINHRTPDLLSLLNLNA